MIQGLGHPCLPKTTFNSDAFHSRFLTLYMHATYPIIGIFKLAHFSPKKKKTYWLMKYLLKNKKLPFFTVIKNYLQSYATFENNLY